MKKCLVDMFAKAAHAMFDSTFSLQPLKLRHVEPVGGILVTNAEGSL
jgi:hypothetical protein